MTFRFVCCDLRRIPTASKERRNNSRWLLEKVAYNERASLSFFCLAVFRENKSSPRIDVGVQDVSCLRGQCNKVKEGEGKGCFNAYLPPSLFALKLLKWGEISSIVGRIGYSTVGRATLSPL